MLQRKNWTSSPFNKKGWEGSYFKAAKKSHSTSCFRDLQMSLKTICLFGFLKIILKCVKGCQKQEILNSHNIKLHCNTQKFKTKSILWDWRYLISRNDKEHCWDLQVVVLNRIQYFNFHFSVRPNFQGYDNVAKGKLRWKGCCKIYKWFTVRAH